MPALVLYRMATTLLESPLRAHLKRRAARGKEDPKRLGERFGQPGRARPDGPLAWIHGASVGESLSVLSLIEELRKRYPSIRILVTTGTITSARLMAERLPEGALHQFAPLDRTAWVKAFLDHWRPDIALWVESELWPNTLRELSRRGIPAVLLNARMSDRSLRLWRLFPPALRKLLDCFELRLAQDDEQARRLSELSGRPVISVGNLKFAATPLPVNEHALAQLSSVVAGRAIWLAASTHPGEEEIVFQAHQELESRHPGLLTILVPRHPNRGSEIVDLLHKAKLSHRRRSAAELPAEDSAIYLADTLGELGLFYRLARIAFIGGSLVPVGGHNPIEACRLGCAVIHGPYVSNFAAMTNRLLSEGAAIGVSDKESLVIALDRLLSEPAVGIAMGARGAALAEQEAAALSRVLGEIEPVIAKVLRD